MTGPAPAGPSERPDLDATVLRQPGIAIVAGDGRKLAQAVDAVRGDAVGGKAARNSCGAPLGELPVDLRPATGIGEAQHHELHVGLLGLGCLPIVGKSPKIAQGAVVEVVGSALEAESDAEPRSVVTGHQLGEALEIGKAGVARIGKQHGAADGLVRIALAARLERQVDEAGILDDRMRLVGQRKSQEVGGIRVALLRRIVQEEPARERIFLGLDRIFRRPAEQAAALRNGKRLGILDIGQSDEADAQRVVRNAFRKIGVEFELPAPAPTSSPFITSVLKVS